MANFTEKSKLKGILNAYAVDALFSQIPEGAESDVILAVDRLITLKTGVEPAATNDAMLENIAGLIVIEQLSLQHQDLDEKEMARRTKLADDARRILNEIANGTIQLDGDASDDATFSDDWRTANPTLVSSRNITEW